VKIDVPKLIKDGWKIYYMGPEKMLGPPLDSPYINTAAKIGHVKHNGEMISYFNYSDFPWDDYAL
jgi:hypothetical protein